MIDKIKNSLTDRKQNYTTKINLWIKRLMDGCMDGLIDFMINWMINFEIFVRWFEYGYWKLNYTNIMNVWKIRWMDEWNGYMKNKMIKYNYSNAGFLIVPKTKLFNNNECLKKRCMDW